MMIPKLLQMLNEIFSTSSRPSLLIYLFLVPISFILLRRWLSNPNPYVPPSPPKLPIIGNLHQLSFLPHRDFQTMSQKYGPIMLLHFGSRPVLVISSAETASQILKTHDLVFSDRPKFIMFEKMLYDYRDIVSAPYGEYWRQLRSISVLNLLSNKMIRCYDVVRLEEIRLMLDNILESCSTTSTSSILNLSEMLFKLSNDITFRIVMGRTSSDGGKTFMKLMNDMQGFFTRVNIGDYIPWLSWVTRLTGFDAELEDISKRTDDFLDKGKERLMLTQKGKLERK